MKNKAGCVSKYFTKKGIRLWRYRFDGDPVEGKRRQVSEAGFATRAEANEALKKAVEAHAKGENAPLIPPSPPKEHSEIGCELG